MAQSSKTMEALRRALLTMAEDAYTERDRAQTPSAAKYADGEGHAYGIAANEIRKLETASR
jgi:hypothetical protein